MGPDRIIMSKANTSMAKPRKTIQNMLDSMEIIPKEKLLPHLTQICMPVKAVDYPKLTRSVGHQDNIYSSTFLLYSNTEGHSTKQGKALS
eukprot:8955094-Ditylum_brightwellii.AAC.1